MNEKVREYNKMKLAESFAKVLNGTYNQADYLENAINLVIDYTVHDEDERENAKKMVS